jgi:hypothetical protein
MTGSGKTGLLMVLVEEAIKNRVPVLLVDVKGDLPNLLLAFPELSARDFEPWIDGDAAMREGKSAAQVAADTAGAWREGLAGWGLGPQDVGTLAGAMAPRLITPGTTAGEPLHVLSSLETRSSLWEEDEEAAREQVSASVSLLLRLVERDADPARSREHVVLSLLAERRHRAHMPAGLAELLADLAAPPVAQVGALAMDEFLPPKERQTLAQELNALLASPTFASWRQGTPLDIGAWLRPAPPRPGETAPRTPAVVVSVAHLDDAERMLVLGLLLEQVLSWVRGLPGTSQLRALVVFDEVFGFLPPHPHSPPTKRPLLALLKQARAFGVGVVVATQNPMDLDYKALSNAGVWFVGRLQTDADRERVVEGLVGSDGGAGGLDAEALAATVKSLPPRTFFVRNVHDRPPTCLLETRWTLSWLRGPMTRREIGRLAKALPRDASAAMSPGAANAPLPTAPEPPVAAIAPAAGPPVPIAGRGGVAPTVLDAESAPAGAPASPDGWETFHGHPLPLPIDQWIYLPHVAVTAMAHVRDSKLGAAFNRTITFAAPIAADGRPDLSKAREVAREHLDAQPVPGGRYRPLPGGLFLKKGMQAAERAMREHVYRNVSVQVDVHRELGIVRGDAETPQAFMARCAAEAQRQMAARQQEIAARHAPKIAKLEQRLARTQAEAAQGDAGGTAGTVGAVIVGAFGGRLGSRLHAQHAKAAARAERARNAWAQADAALREAVATRDAEITIAMQSAGRAHEGIESVRLTVKKGDVEVTEIGVAWAAASG